MSAIGLGCMGMSAAYGVADEKKVSKHCIVHWNSELTFGTLPMCMAMVQMKNYYLKYWLKKEIRFYCNKIRFPFT